MSDFPAANLLGNASTNQGNFKAYIEAFLLASKELVGSGAGTSIAIASGTATPGTGHNGMLIVDSEGAAGDDDLTHITLTNIREGGTVWVRAANAGRTITCKHAQTGAGQMLLATDADFALDDVDKGVLFYRSGIDLIELTRCWGSDKAGFLVDMGAVLAASVDTVWVPAASMEPLVTAGCADIASFELAANTPNVRALAFDQSSVEYAQFSVRFPKRWDAGTLTFQPIWSATTGTSGTVSWSLQAVALADGDTIDQAYGTAVVSNDTFSALKREHVGPVSGAITVANTPTKGDRVAFRLARVATDAVNDTFNSDALLIGVVVFFNVDAGTDA